MSRISATPDTSFSNDDQPSKRTKRMKRESEPPATQEALTLPSPESAADTSPYSPPAADADEDEADADADADTTDACSDRSADFCEEAIQQAETTIDNHSRGRPPSRAHATFHLGGQQAFERLHHRLEERRLLDVFRALRPAWNATTGNLRLLMIPSVLHETLQHFISSALNQELDRIACEYPPLLRFRRNLKGAGHSNVEKFAQSDLPVFLKSPDGQFRYIESSEPSPTFIFEIAYSQTEEDLDQTVQEYYEDGPATATILAVNIEYAPPHIRSAHDHCHRGSMSWYTMIPDDDAGDDTDVISTTIRRMMNGQVFRDKDGRARPGQLEIPFELFLPFAVREQAGPLARQAKLRLSFEALANEVKDAEMLQRQREEARRVQKEQPPARKKRVIKWVDEDDDEVFRQTKVPERKRQKTTPTMPTRATRSTSRPRRSSRLSV
ncbi:hypothetical protein GGR56DRAFT_153441 [Xylariaceae sp. FL0804]|nr:hypothetical protein GGR56DRAFT_153441 [Xylariaceae sp. FL0804]